LRVFGDEMPITHDAAFEHACALDALGQTNDAVALLLRVVAGRQRLLGAGHPMLLAALDRLALVHERAGAFDEAEPLLRNYVEQWRSTAVEQHHRSLHRHTEYHLAVACRLAVARLALGRPAEALPLLREVADVLRVRQGAEHPAALAAAAALQAAEGAPGGGVPGESAGVVTARRVMAAMWEWISRGSAAPPLPPRP
jgi:hypothetical protein